VIGVSEQADKGTAEGVWRFILDYLREDLGGSVDFICRMTRSNLDVARKLQGDFVRGVVEDLGRADEACDIAMSILSYESLPQLIVKKSEKDDWGKLLDVIGDLAELHVNLKALQDNREGGNVERVKELSSAVAMRLDGLLGNMIASIAKGVYELMGSRSVWSHDIDKDNNKDNKDEDNDDDDDEDDDEEE
jgi:hypothetical protein